MTVIALACARAVHLAHVCIRPALLCCGSFPAGDTPADKVCANMPALLSISVKSRHERLLRAIDFMTVNRCQLQTEIARRMQCECLLSAVPCTGDSRHNRSLSWLGSARRTEGQMRHQARVVRGSSQSPRAPIATRDSRYNGWAPEDMIFWGETLDKYRPGLGKPSTVTRSVLARVTCTEFVCKHIVSIRMLCVAYLRRHVDPHIRRCALAR